MSASIQNPNMFRQDFPHLTTDEVVNIFDRDSQFLELEWLNGEGIPDWLYRDDSVMNKVLELVDPVQESFENPIHYWTEMSRLEAATQTTAEVNSSATTIPVEDGGLFSAGMHMHVPETGEWMNVVSRSGNNVVVERGALGTTAMTVKAGSSVLSAPQFIPELGEPKMGVSQQPGERQYNFVSVFGERFGVSHFKNNAKIRGGWGQLPLVTLQQWASLRRRVGFAMVHSPRFTEMTNEGQRFVSGGVRHYIKSNIFPIGNDSSALTWEIYNDALRNSFAPDASSNQKLQLTGPKLYRSMLKSAREAGSIVDGPYWSPALAADSFTASVDGGTISVVQAKHDLPEQGKYQFGDWAIGLDLKNLHSGSLKSFEWKVIPEVQTALGGIMQRQDAIVGSGAVVLKHEQTHYIIKGAPDRNVKRVEIA